MQNLMELMDTHSDSSHIRRRDKKQRFYIDNEFVDQGYLSFSRRAASVYFALARHANAENQDCFPSYELLMKETGIKNRSSIARAIDALENANTISVKRSRNRKGNHYYLLDTSQWRKLNSLSSKTVSTVSTTSPKQSRFRRLNRSSGETGNQHMKSTNEIIENKSKIPEDIRKWSEDFRRRLRE